MMGFLLSSNNFVFILFFVTCKFGESQKSCPGSPALKNAKCAMTVSFPYSSCESVRAEILDRMNGVNEWEDPHNKGKYALIQSSSSNDDADGLLFTIEGSRVTGDGKYKDLFGFEMKDNTQENVTGCDLSACSESQVFSILDFSTNYCNLRSLYCNASDDNCPIVNSNLGYEETYVKCNQRDVKKCTSPKDAA